MSNNISGLEKFKNHLKVIFTSIAIATSAIIQSEYALIPDKKSISVILTTLLLLFVVELLLVIVSLFISRFSKLRMWILGSEYIEGVWFDRADKHFAIITIVYNKGEYSVLGEVFDRDGTFLGNWNSDFSYFDKGIFKYIYKSNYGIRVENNMGFCEYTFNSSNNEKIPNQFSGYYIDIKNFSSKTRISGEKLTKEVSDKLTSNKNKSDWIRKMK
jgi:hypothetical protein